MVHGRMPDRGRRLRDGATTRRLDLSLRFSVVASRRKGAEPDRPRLFDIPEAELFRFRVFRHVGLRVGRADVVMPADMAFQRVHVARGFRAVNELRPVAEKGRSGLRGRDVIFRSARSFRFHSD